MQYDIKCCDARVKNEHSHISHLGVDTLTRMYSMIQIMLTIPCPSHPSVKNTREGNRHVHTHTTSRIRSRHGHRIPLISKNFIFHAK